MKKELTCVAARRNEIKETIANIRVTLAAVDEKIMSESAKSDALMVFIAEEREEKNKRDVQYTELSARKDQILLESGEINARLQQMYKDVETFLSEITIQKYEIDNNEKHLENDLAGLKLAQQESRQVQTELNQIEISETEKKMTFENKDELAHNAYHTRYRDLPPEHKVQEIYGVWQEKKFLGKTYMGTLRTSFLIDEKGKIAKIYEKVRPPVHAAEVLKDIKI